MSIRRVEPGREEARKRALKDPDESFIEFADWRLDNYQHPLMRTVSRLIAKNDVGKVATLHKVTWPAQIKWAQRYRGHLDDTHAVAAEYFLKIASKNPDGAFSKFTEFMLSPHTHLAARESRQTGAPVDDEAPDRIEDAPLDGMWSPPCIHFILSLGVLDRMSEEQLHKSAERIRAGYREDVSHKIHVEAIEHLKKYPLTRRPSMVHWAVNNGISFKYLRQHLQGLPPRDRRKGS